MADSGHTEVESLRLLDANCRLGPSNLTTENTPSSFAQLQAELERCGISEALVYHSLASGYDPSFGNERLLEEIADSSGFHACMVVIPSDRSEHSELSVASRDLFASKMRAARVFPRRHRVSLSGWSADGLLQDLASHKIPLFIDFDRNHWADEFVEYDQLFRICNTFPDLPVILVREGIGSTRYLYPLLEKFENLYIEISYYQVSRGLEEIAHRFGAHHLLFGTGLPDYSAGPAVSMLLLSDLSLAEKRLIGGDNLRALLRSAI